jgi:prolyl 4-hydroxylase
MYLLAISFLLCLPKQHHDFGYARIDDTHQSARFATLLLYLNEPEAGGETSFPRWQNAEVNLVSCCFRSKHSNRIALFHSHSFSFALRFALHNFKSFDQLKVPPESGKAVLFYSQLPDGNLDDFSHHAALPVKKGEKWLVSNSTVSHNVACRLINASSPFQLSMPITEHCRLIYGCGM